METEAKKQELENQQAALETYLSHPVTREVLRDNDEQSEALITQILEIPVTDLESFLKREQAFGHLRGLRRTKARVMENLEDVKEKLKELRS